MPDQQQDPKRDRRTKAELRERIEDLETEACVLRRDRNDTARELTTMTQVAEKADIANRATISELQHRATAVVKAADAIGATGMAERDDYGKGFVEGLDAARMIVQGDKTVRYAWEP